MSRSPARWCPIILAIFAIVGCAGATMVPPTSNNVPDLTPQPRLFARAGETFAYVGKLFGIPAARVTVAVGDAGVVDGRRAVKIRSRGFNDLLSVVAELKWELTTTLDLEEGLPLEATEDATLEFAGRTDHERDRREWSDDHQHDVHSTLCMMRGWQGQPGAKAKLTLSVGGGNFSTEIWDAGRERVGDYPAVRFDGISLSHDRQPHHFSVWISDDLDRVPLKIRAETKWGDLTIELVDYETNRT